jgi:hypothetical protein
MKEENTIIKVMKNVTEPLVMNTSKHDKEGGNTCDIESADNDNVHPKPLKGRCTLDPSVMRTQHKERYSEAYTSLCINK